MHYFYLSIRFNANDNALLLSVYLQILPIDMPLQAFWQAVHIRVMKMNKDKRMILSPRQNERLKLDR